MKAEILTSADSKLIEEFLAQQIFLPIQQTLQWEKLQNSLNSRSWKIGIKEGKALSGFALVFAKRLPFGFRWLHLPRGILAVDSASRKAIYEKLLEIGKKENHVFIRFDWQRDSEINAKELQSAHTTHFPQTTLILDLQQSEEELLAQMKPKGRYNIRVAEKHGVTIRESHEASDAKIFAELLKKTTERDGFSSHPDSYYEKFISELGDTASCFIAEYEGKAIAASICTFAGDTATYYYGSSNHEFRNVMAPYALQWKAIQTAKERGFHYYDFLGISPEDSTNHAWSGVTDFKKKFGGEVVNYPTSSELILRKTAFNFIRLLKKIRG
ncbi:MAG: peptidoglycan bridge formation glycyltransferase FemA/FemB family protein [Candidatus Gracilibacteria bacterium]|nr:peptidoglycan bridge formation glycyltransferase FemA/FemB family protein [Candidatus Gracilibacteria bacterium]MDD5179143.1 peptidoglycan bridge formation glycyltransferase FemA/FemB family protein [Candidatus Gracilibacteria bacterium]